MSLPNQDSEGGVADGRTDEQIAADVDDKLRAAVDAAITSGSVDADRPITVAVDQSGSIHVFNEDTQSQEQGTPDSVEFPALYNEDHESETERYADHLATHWGF